ncbi:MAG: MmcQ/YjbR family DNA-binding protein [candidate division Zixibacteria bacterium]|nr:MmcQ/YjbR family DNA-binding protein [candidate division Zixibacteria bacterium]
MLTNKSRYFKRIRNWSLKQVDTAEEFPWQHIVFKVKGKLFAICNTEKPLRITLKPQKDNVDAYLYHPDIAIASHVGRFGWITITIQNKDTADLGFALVKESYGVISSKHRKKKK